jgi:hypothetical protein
MNNFPRETVEFLPIIVTVNDVVTTTGIQFSDVPDGARPLTWVAPVTLSGQIGVMVQGYGPGRRRVFAQATENPEVAVIDCGVYTVT